MATLGNDEIISIIRKAQGEKSLRTFATEIGVSAAYLSDVFRGNRKPGQKILNFFNMTQTKTVTVTYTVTRRKK